MKLTPHEKKILELIAKYPDIVENPVSRKLIAKQYGFTEKTLRNRIGDLKKYGILNEMKSNGFSQILQSDDSNLIDLFPILWDNKKNLVKNCFLISIITV